MTVVDSLAKAVWTIPLGGTGYWYLFVLVVFFAVCRALHRVGPALLVASIALYAAAPFVSQLVSNGFPSPVSEVVGDTVIRLLTYFVWYALGFFAPSYVARAAESGWRMLAIALVAYLALVVLQLTGAGTTGARGLAISITGTVVALIIARVLSGWPAARRLGRYLAQRTLAIYLVHHVALATLIWITLGVTDGAGVPRGLGAEWWLTPLLTVTLIAVSCLTYDVAMRSPLRYAFVPPGQTSGRTRIQTSSA
jgi:peptidoglycan/LPS O-acetylase OafA/YrhL